MRTTVRGASAGLGLILAVALGPAPAHALPGTQAPAPALVRQSTPAPSAEATPASDADLLVQGPESITTREPNRRIMAAKAAVPISALLAFALLLFVRTSEKPPMPAPDPRGRRR